MRDRVGRVEEGFYAEAEFAAGKEKKDFSTESQRKRKRDEKGFNAEKEKSRRRGCCEPQEGKKAMPSNDGDCRVMARLAFRRELSRCC
jgi:hypothetical protein